MRQENGSGASCRLVAEGTRITRPVLSDGKSDRHGHLTYGQAVEITRTYHGKAYTWWSRPSRSANACGRPGAYAP
jgi:hypothetical protein